MEPRSGALMEPRSGTLMESHSGVLGEPRMHGDPSLRGRPGRGWVMVEGAPLHGGQVPPWPMPGPSSRHQLSHDGGGLIKPGSAHHPRYQPYEHHRPHIQFTIQDIDKCLFGKQDIRVVQIGDEKPSPIERPASKGSSTGGPEDKNKPAKWCDMCQEIRFGECPQHGPLPSLRPSVTLPGPKSYAISTFPDEVGLCISSLPLAGYGVFARHFIPIGTWIGPYEGKKISAEEGLKQISQGDAPFLWEIYENYRLSHFLDASDENSSSWMRFIQCARHHGEQNLFVFQYYGSIYYRAFKDILVGQELLLWYDDKYPQYFGLPYDVRDMSSCSMESIQAPMEVTKTPTDGEKKKEGVHMDSDRRSRGSFAPPHGKVISNPPPNNPRERNEPPRIPSNSHMQHLLNQPPTLSQAPSLLDGRSSTAFMDGRIPHPEGRMPHPNIPQGRQSSHPPSGLLHGQSPRPAHGFPKEEPRSPNSMLRSMSAEDLRKRNQAERNQKREFVERPGYGNEGVIHPPPAILFAAHMNNPHSPMPSSGTFSRLPPSVMSVASAEQAKKYEESNRHNELKVLHERERLMERDRIMHEREKIERERARSRGLIAPHEMHPREMQETWDSFQCQGCGQTFHQKLAFERHHCTKEASKPFQCGKCQLSFPEVHDLQEHMTMHTSERPFKCGVCSRSFAGTSALSNHMRMHGNNGMNSSEKLPLNKDKQQQTIDCHKCGKKFHHPSEMNKHLSASGECIS